MTASSGCTASPRVARQRRYARSAALMVAALLVVLTSSICSATKRRMSSGRSSSNASGRPANLWISSRSTMRSRLSRVPSAKPAGVAHVRVVATQLIGNRTSRRGQLGDDTLPAQHGQQRHQCRVGLARVPHRMRRAAAVRQVVVQELIDAALVESARRQSAQRHPVREVRQRSRGIDCTVPRRVTARASGARRRPARTRPAVRRAARLGRCGEGRDLGHGGLQKCGDAVLPRPPKLCPVQRVERLDITRRRAARLSPRPRHCS